MIKLNIIIYLADNEMQQEIVCMICNDGDFSDENLIVICFGCNVSVH